MVFLLSPSLRQEEMGEGGHLGQDCSGKGHC